MKVLVFVEHHRDELSASALGVLSKAASLGVEVGAAIIGRDSAMLATEAAGYGASTVHIADDASLESPLPQPRVDVLAAIMRGGGYDTVFLANSVLAADIAAGLSARFDAGLNWDLTDVTVESGTLIGKRPALRDSVYVDVGWRGEPRIALFRAGSFEAVATGSGRPHIEPVVVEFEEHSRLATIVDQLLEESSGTSIEDADVIVSVGRGLEAPENLVLAEELAEALSGAVGGTAAIGATRPVVDAGWCPYSAQIGQTGKTVSPRLYVALGISGAVQHNVGMRNSRIIVAINKDANAPIFAVCQLGVVGDLHEIVPRLTELLRQRCQS